MSDSDRTEPLVLPPAFRITPCGEYEFAFLRFLLAHTHPEMSNASEGYYASLRRITQHGLWGRAATLGVLADEVWMACFDWPFRPGDRDHYTEGTRTLQIPELGVGLSYGGWVEWDDDLKALVGMLLRAGAIDTRSLARLTSPQSRKDYLAVEGLGRFETTSFQALCRLLHQMRTAGSLKTTLLISEDDHLLLQTITRFLQDNQWPMPFDLPDLSHLSNLSASEPTFGLLLFNPPDFESALAVRRDPSVMKYASRVRQLAFNPDHRFREANLVAAMKEAFEDARMTRRARRVFEADTWICHALAFIPVLDKLAAFGEIVLDGCKKWIERKAKEEEWRFIGPRMQEIAIEDYLNRKGNISTGPD
jgi:hypothetical protein